jgi:hypothetical protein
LHKVKYSMKLPKETPSHEPVYTILGMDGGKANFGYAVLRFRMHHGVLQWKVTETGVIPCPVNDMKIADDQLPAFMRWVETTRNRLGVTHMIAERFQTRGASTMGTTIECVNLMYGAMLHRYKHEFQMIPAVQWKGRVLKRLGDKLKLKEWYAEGKGGRGGYRGTAHELDASLQAMYKAQTLYGLPTEYLCLDKFRLTLAIEAASCCAETHDRIRKQDIAEAKLAGNAKPMKKAVPTKKKQLKGRKK